jgi:hypothetical protein
MPNPASVYYEQNGNKLEIRTAADGSQSGSVFFRMAAPVMSGLITDEVPHSSLLIELVFFPSQNRTNVL